MSDIIKVFVSYSWDNEKHKEWVLHLTNNLRENYGLDVILDQYELSAGKNMIYFMERSLEIADKVLLILTPNYKMKAENRERGVGFGYSMISQEFYKNQAKNEKFIPILRSGDNEKSAPGYIESLITHSMKDDTTFESDLETLARIIYNKPILKKPKIGAVPDFDKVSLEKDPVIEKARNLSNQIELKQKQKEYLSSESGLIEANNQFNQLLRGLEDKANHYKQNTRFRFSITSARTSPQPDPYNPPFANLVGEGIFCFHFYFNIIDRYIAVSLWNRPPSNGNVFYFPGEEPKQLTIGDIYYFAISDDFEPKWRNNLDELFTIEDIIRKYFIALMDEIIEKKKKEGM